MRARPSRALIYFGTPTHAGNGDERTYASTTTNYNWNSYGELCSVGSTAAGSGTGTSSGCGITPSGDMGYTYNGDGLRTLTTTSTSTTESTWDTVSGGSIPLNINDATTTTSSPGVTTDTSYVYGDLLFGGTAPVEQITTTPSGSSVDFIVASQTGVAGVYSSSGTTLELAQYSTYGVQTITSGSDVTPFGFQGSYTDATGLIYLINRYYDPTTDQFLSIDPDVATTDQPYVFANDDPLNSVDPVGADPNLGELETEAAQRDTPQPPPETGVAAVASAALGQASADEAEQAKSVTKADNIIQNVNADIQSDLNQISVDAAIGIYAFADVSAIQSLSTAAAGVLAGLGQQIVTLGYDAYSLYKNYQTFASATEDDLAADALVTATKGTSLEGLAFAIKAETSSAVVDAAGDVTGSLQDLGQDILKAFIPK
jgi:RHS repeat-associated protein